VHAAIVACSEFRRPRYAEEEEIMDKDRIVGSGKQIKGAVKQVVGKAVGDAKPESEGKADKIEGKVQNTLAASKTRSKVNSRTATGARWCTLALYTCWYPVGVHFLL
jgi:uncharacterized protein YjbJ (UPF0337 family)